MDSWVVNIKEMKHRLTTYLCWSSALYVATARLLQDIIMADI